MPYTGGLTQQQVADLPVKGGRWQSTGRDLGQWKIPLAPPSAVGPEESWAFFHPGRADVRFAPEEWLDRIQEIDPRLSIVWHPVKERWAVWMRDPTSTFWMCRGWKLVMPWANPYRRDAAGNWGYLPLDERMLANVWDRCGRVQGTGIQYWERIQGEILRDKDRKEKQRQADVRDMSGEYFDYRQIKNIGRGSKFAESHAE